MNRIPNISTMLPLNIAGYLRRFRLLNHRADMKFIMVTNLTNWLGLFDVVAESPLIKIRNYNEPLQGHLARTKDLRCVHA